MYKKQTAVLHSSTEFEVLSLNAGLRVDGFLALDLWDIVIEVLRKTKDNTQPNHTSTRKLKADQPNHTRSRNWQQFNPNWAACDSKTKNQHPNRKRWIDQLSEVDHVPTNTRSSQGKPQLYIFEDNEAVIKMKIRGRSPTR